MANEFDTIGRYFTRPTPQSELGVGDDAALIKVGKGMELAVSADMLVARTHFFEDVDPYKLGWKTLAVNVSDMAAMGAQPRWATLSIALPKIDEIWLAGFSKGFFACAETFGVDLIGGDTTRGPLTLNVTIMGEVPTGAALKRSGAKVGDDIWVSGTLGDAAFALAILQQRLHATDDDLSLTRKALEQPEPRVSLGLKLRGIAHSAIDISDGLLADLGHILKASSVGADIHFDSIPRSSTVSHHLHEKPLQAMILAGGDDYELCFTTPSDQRAEIEKLALKLGVPLTKVGQISAETGLRVWGSNGQELDIKETGFDHFA